MMPKGVEHTMNKLKTSARNKVSLPMMPKGVEHWTTIETVLGLVGESSDDAERR